jgi:hypothetical protein
MCSRYDSVPPLTPIVELHSPCQGMCDSGTCVWSARRMQRPVCSAGVHFCVVCVAQGLAPQPAASSVLPHAQFTAPETCFAKPNGWLPIACCIHPIRTGVFLFSSPSCSRICVSQLVSSCLAEWGVCLTVCASQFDQTAPLVCELDTPAIITLQSSVCVCVHLLPFDGTAASCVPCNIQAFTDQRWQSPQHQQPAKPAAP